MKSTMNKSFRFWAIAFLVAGLCLFIYGSRMWSAKTASQQVPTGSAREVTIRVKNFAENFEVINLERMHGQRVRLTVRNNYDKDITAFALSPGKGQVRVDFGEEQKIAPGNTHVETFTLNDPDAPTPEEQVITILAVVFEDKTGDGNSKVITEIKDHRRGKKAQLLRILPHLNRVINAPDEHLTARFQAARLVVNQLPTRIAEESSYDFMAGLQNARQSILREFEQLDQLKREHGISAFRSKLLKVKQRYDKRIIAF